MGVAVTGMITAGFYSTYPIVHFILLGLLWGPAWLLLSVVIAQESAKVGSKPGFRLTQTGQITS